MKKIINYISFLVLSIIVISCSNDSIIIQNISQEKEEVLVDSLRENEMVAYTLPSPLQIASVVKMLEISFKEYYIEDTKNNSFNYSSRTDRAICLGFNIIDMGYAAVNEQSQTTLTYLKKIETIAQELGMQSKNDSELFLRLHNNIESKDSLLSIIQEYQNNIAEYLKASQESNLSFIIIAGMYIEGLYIASTAYDEQIRAKKTNHFHESILNQLLFQQKIVCTNITELLENYHDNKLQPLIQQMKDLSESFTLLQISYQVNNDTHKIKKVSLNITKISILKETISSIRNSFIQRNIIN